MIATLSGRLRRRLEDRIILEARFALNDKDAGYVVFRRGDRFIEWFYCNRWYNIFEMHAVEDDHLKGWYCNISRPAIFTSDSVQADDLALDLWVDPQGKSQVLDQDEFAALPLDDKTRLAALLGLDALLAHLARRDPPFEKIPII